MLLDQRTQIAVNNVRRYRQLSLAESAAIKQRYWTSILFGGDGLWWVPATHREGRLLVARGLACVRDCDE